jgi:acetyl-CoA acyltransferase
MKNAVIVDSVRTGLAKSHRGGFNMTRPDDMLSHIINSLLERNPNLPPEMVEDVIMGCGSPEGAQGHNLGRNAAVLSNLPITVGGTTVNRYCSLECRLFLWQLLKLWLVVMTQLLLVVQKQFL